MLAIFRLPCVKGAVAERLRDCKKLIFNNPPVTAYAAPPSFTQGGLLSFCVAEHLYKPQFLGATAQDIVSIFRFFPLFPFWGYPVPKRWNMPVAQAVSCLCDYILICLRQKMNNSLCKNGRSKFTICAKKVLCRVTQRIF